MGKGKKNFNSMSWITIVGFISSILTIVQVIIYIVFLPENADRENLWQLIVYQSAIVTCVIALCSLLARSQYKIVEINEKMYRLSDEKDIMEKDLESKNRVINELSLNNHNILHEVRQVQYKLYKHFINELFIFNERGHANTDNVDICDIFDREETGNYDLKDFMTFFTTNVKTSFDSLTGDKCSVYISLFDDYDKKSVRTYYRDPLSYTERTNIDLQYPVYNISSFTPFKHILNECTIDSVFACDDCINYSNFCDRNDDWNTFYNSCISIPIRLRVNKEANRHHVLGFLTIDNNKGGLDNQIAKSIARSYADCLYMVFCMYIINDALIEENEEYEASEEN